MIRMIKLFNIISVLYLHGVISYNPENRICVQKYFDKNNIFIIFLKAIFF